MKRTAREIYSQYASLRTHVAGAPFNDRYVETFGNSLTPQTVSPILRQAEHGYLYRYADMLEELRERDAHLDCVLSKREEAITGSEWELRPPSGSGYLGSEIADFVKEKIECICGDGELSLGFDDAITHLLSAIYHGRTGIEIVWVDDGSYSVPARFFMVHPRRFAYAATDNWRLHLWDHSIPTHGPNPFSVWPGVPLDSLPAGKFIVHKGRSRGSYPTRAGVGRVTLWWSIFKRFDVRDWLALAQWAGRGLRTGKYQTGQNGQHEATPDDVNAMREALEEWSSSNVLTHPDTTEIELHSMPGNNDIHSTLALFCNTEISKAVLGETLTTEVGTTGGNRALGDVMNEMRLTRARSDAKSLSDTLYRDLIRPIVAMNFGEHAPVPRIFWSVDPKQDKDAFAKRIASLVKDCGLKVSQDYVRNELGIEDPADGSDLLIST